MTKLKVVIIADVPFGRDSDLFGLARYASSYWLCSASRDANSALWLDSPLSNRGRAIISSVVKQHIVISTCVRQDVLSILYTHTGPLSLQRLSGNINW